MILEDYFDFLGEDDIRIKGTRVGVETVLYDFIHRKIAPEAIVEKYRTLTLDQIYATILYYLRNQEKMDAYLADWLEWGHRMREQQRRERPNFRQELLALRESQPRYSVDGE